MAIRICAGTQFLVTGDCHAGDFIDEFCMRDSCFGLKAVSPLFFGPEKYSAHKPLHLTPIGD
jgi:hypothetical protein